MAARESDSIDSGELWLPGTVRRVSDKSAPSERRGGRHQQDLIPPHMSASMRRTIHDLLASVAGRERLWMSPHLRTLSPAMRVKIIYELEKLGATLAQM